MFREEPQSNRRVVVKDDPDEHSEIVLMEFRLNYEGPLLSTQKDPVDGQKDARADHKHEIRRQFHPQLRRLWEIHPFLRDFKIDPQDLPWMLKQHSDSAMRLVSGGPESSLREILAGQYRENGYEFIPLVSEGLSLACELDVLFMRRDAPGAIIQSGDIDNRLKTLLDALRKPKRANELGKYTVPGADESPFYCLLEDDKLITKLTVETDWLLSPLTSAPLDDKMVHLIIKVTLRPSVVSGINLNFV
jgi:hypothetical protein